MNSETKIENLRELGRDLEGGGDESFSVVGDDSRRIRQVLIRETRLQEMLLIRRFRSEFRLVIEGSLGSCL